MMHLIISVILFIQFSFSFYSLTNTVASDVLSETTLLLTHVLAAIFALKLFASHLRTFKTAKAYDCYSRYFNKYATYNTFMYMY